MILRSVVAAWVVGAIAASTPASWAASINFDTDAAGNPLSAPADFADTSPLTNLYATLGVNFSGPSAGNGGAILNQTGGFGVNARSGQNFLAFNGGSIGTAYTASNPETISFDLSQSMVSLWVSVGGIPGSTISLTAFDASSNVVSTDALTISTGSTYSQLLVTGAGIRSVALTGPSVFVADDLGFSTAGTAAPLPNTAVLGIPCILGAAMFSRMRRRQTEGV